jgi:hypothetical protein
MKFKLKEDWIHESTFLDKKIVKKLYDKGHVFEPTEGMYEVIHHTGEIFKLTESQMNSFEILEQIKNVEDFEIIIEELPDDDDNLVRNWRIQLDVKTTKKKLKEVQQLIEEHIRPIL